MTVYAESTPSTFDPTNIYYTDGNRFLDMLGGFGMYAVGRNNERVREALVESLAIGLRALGISANAQLPEEEQQISSKVWGGTIVVALAFSIGLFFVVPVGVTSLIKDQLGSSLLFWLVEGVLRTAIFLGYLTLLSRVRDLRRVF